MQARASCRLAEMIAKRAPDDLAAGGYHAIDARLACVLVDQRPLRHFHSSRIAVRRLNLHRAGRFAIKRLIDQRLAGHEIERDARSVDREASDECLAEGITRGRVSNLAQSAAVGGEREGAGCRTAPADGFECVHTRRLDGSHRRRAVGARGEARQCGSERESECV